MWATVLECNLLLGLDEAQDKRENTLTFVSLTGSSRASLRAFVKHLRRATVSSNHDVRAMLSCIPWFLRRTLLGPDMGVLQTGWTDLPADDPELNAEGGELLPVHVFVPVNI